MKKQKEKWSEIFFDECIYFKSMSIYSNCVLLIWKNFKRFYYVVFIESFANIEKKIEKTFIRDLLGKKKKR